MAAHEEEQLREEKPGSGASQSSGPTADAQPESDLSPIGVRNYLLYGLSVPERALRSTAALVGGTLRESTALLLPQAFRSSKTYSVFVQQMLDFMVTNVGNVESNEAAEDQGEVQDFVARKAVGGFIELASLPLLHVSPITVLAIVNDVAYGSKTYLRELSDELKKEGVIDDEATIEGAADLLEALGNASGMTADAVDLPPLSTAGLKETIEQTQDALKSLDLRKALPQAEVERLWNEMHEIATREEVGIMDVSSAMAMYAMNKIGSLGQGALSSVRVAGNMFDRHILNYYSEAMSAINSKGYYATLAECSSPYIDATWRNFSTDQATWTEDLFTGRFLRRTVDTARGWLDSGSGDEADGPDS